MNKEVKSYDREKTKNRWMEKLEFVIQYRFPFEFTVSYIAEKR